MLVLKKCDQSSRQCFVVCQNVSLSYTVTYGRSIQLTAPILRVLKMEV